MTSREHILQAQCRAYAEIALPQEAIFHHSPNEGLRGFKAQRAIKSGGVRRGFPDILILWDGRAFTVELKTATGRVSSAQKQFAADATAAGVPHAICRSIEEFDAALRSFGLPLKASLRDCPTELEAYHGFRL